MDKDIITFSEETKPIIRFDGYSDQDMRGIIHSIEYLSRVSHTNVAKVKDIIVHCEIIDGKIVVSKITSNFYG